MKEKLMGLLGMISKNKKSAIICVVAIVVLILLIVLIANLTSAKPKKYEDKIKDMTKALASESKMKDAIDELIDLRAAAAWQEADCDAKDFKDEYKKMKKDADEVGDLEDALKNFASKEEDSLDEIKVSKIGEPKKSSKNSKIYTVSATITTKSKYSYYSDTETDESVKFVFYKGKIIDIIFKDSDESIFKSALDYNK